MNLTKKQRRILLNGLGYVTTVGVTLGIVLPITLGSRTDSHIGGTQRLSFLSNLPQWNDKGFQEYTYKGAAKYTYETDQKLGVRGVTYTEDGSSYTQPIKTMYARGADIIVSSGFNVSGFSFDNPPDHNAIWAVLSDEAYSDKGYVLIDYELAREDGHGNELYGSATSIKFSSHEAGFFAGLAASIWAEKTLEEYNIGEQLVTWGGMPYDVVIDWMSGYEQAINYYNWLVEVNNADVEKLWISSGGWIPGSERNEIDYTIPPETNNEIRGLESWFIGGFEIDGAPGDLARNKSTASEQASVLFPVAGGQTQVALGEAIKRSHQQQVIGVDSDASLTTSSIDDKEHILGSAIKDIELASKLGLWYQDKYLGVGLENPNVGYINMDPQEAEIAKNNDEIWKGSGKEFIGEGETENNWIDKENINTPEKARVQTFSGNYLNGGVGFTDGEQPQLEEAFQKSFLSTEENLIVGKEKLENDDIVDVTVGSITSFGSLMDIAYENNGGSEGIEAKSPTFNICFGSDAPGWPDCPPRGDNTTESQTTNKAIGGADRYDIYPWFIDYSIYNRD